MLAAAAIVFVAGSSTANAQIPSVLKPVQLGVAIGGSIPLGEFGQAVNTGYNATGTVELRPPGLPIGFRIDAGFNRFGVKGGGGNANVFGLTGNVVFNLLSVSPLSPYVIGGAGSYHESAGGSSQNRFGFNVGGGLHIPLTGFSTFIEARYNRVSDVGGGATTFVPVTVGVMF